MSQETLSPDYGFGRTGEKWTVSNRGLLSMPEVHQWLPGDLCHGSVSG